MFIEKLVFLEISQTALLSYAIAATATQTHIGYGILAVLLACRLTHALFLPIERFFICLCMSSWRRPEFRTQIKPTDNRWGRKTHMWHKAVGIFLFWFFFIGNIYWMGNVRVLRAREKGLDSSKRILLWEFLSFFVFSYRFSALFRCFCEKRIPHLWCFVCRVFFFRPS